MPARTPTRRRSHAVANDAILSEVSLRLLGTAGLDRFTFSDVAKETGLSRAPIYARYDSPEDVAVELWQSTLRGELVRLFELSAEWHRGDAPEPSTELVEEFTTPSLAMSAVVEVMAVARRFPTLQDIVETSLDELIDKYLAGHEGPPSIAISQLSVALGSVFLAPVLGPTSPEGWWSALPMLRDFSRDTTAWDVPAVILDPFEIPTTFAPTGDEIFDEFQPAINRVIARVGYEHATANRISREAGRTFNLLYAGFDSKEALMERVVQLWVDAGVDLALVPFIGVSPEKYVERSVASARSLVADVNRQFRNHRNEMVLAARHHPRIGADMARRYLEAASAGLRLFDAHYSGMDEEIGRDIGRVGSLVRSNGFGLCLLASCTRTLEGLEWTPASTALQHLSWNRVIGRMSPRRG